MKLLLVEDDAAMRATLERTFVRRGIAVVTCADGMRALDRWRASAPDVVLLDLSLPGRDGLQVLSQARTEGLTTPVLVLTARGAVGDRVLGLNTGADDYLIKPFDLDELEARVRALARRSSPGAPSPAAWLELGAVRVDASCGAAYHGERLLELAPREAALLRALMRRPGHALAKEHLFELVFDDDTSVQLDAIEVVAYRLRKKLGATGVRLVTLRGLGYLLRAES